MQHLGAGVLLALVSRFSPVLWLHPQERYMPSSLEEYASHTRLWCNDTLQADLPAMNASDPGVREAWARRARGRAGCAARPDASPRLRAGAPPEQLDRRAPVYVYVQTYPGFVEARYIYFYPYNGAYNLLHFFHYLDVSYGEHYIDLEHITLRFARAGAGGVALDRVYFAAHTRQEGVWARPADIEWIDGHPVAYVAYGGHGAYPRPGVYPRIFGLASDFCGAGRLWRPRVVVVNGAERGRGAPRGPPLPGDPFAKLRAMTLGAPGAETNRSTSFVRRLMYLYPENLGAG